MALRIGLTGGIGSGKSTVAALLVRHGAALIDADLISRRLTAQGGGAIPALRAEFGAAALDAHGAMDRAWMRAQVFADSRARERLEGILHPLIRAAMRAEAEVESAAMAEAVLRGAGARYIVLEIPLLAESGRGRQLHALDRVLVVDCPPALQAARVSARSGLAAAQVDSIIRQQAGRAQRLEIADDVIVNAADRGTLEARVQRLHRHYLALAATDHAGAGGDSTGRCGDACSL
jgi:dephospho-CoA kinase